MVNTVRITSIVAVVVAALVLLVIVGPKGVVPKVLAGFALQSDEKTQDILEKPSAVEQWRQQHGGTKQAEPETPVLVQQAELLQQILDPPAPIKPPTERNRRDRIARTPPPTPVVTSTKFDLVGTSCEEGNPAGSFAYIYITGDKSYQWVQIGDEIGHYKVKEVKTDALVCFDGRSDVEIPMTASTGLPASIEDTDATATAANETERDASSIPDAFRQSGSSRITGRPVPEPWKRGGQEEGPGSANALRGRSEADRRARELVKRMKDAGHDEPGAKLEDRAAAVRRMISEFRSSQVGPNEARKIEDLGRELNETN